MTINIEKDYVIRIEDENKQLKQRISKLVDENKRLKKSHSNGWKEKDKVIKKLNEKNNELKNQLFNDYLHQQHNERLISELKIALSSYNNFVDEMFPD